MPNIAERVGYEKNLENYEDLIKQYERFKREEKRLEKELGSSLSKISEDVVRCIIPSFERYGYEVSESNSISEDYIAKKGEKRRIAIDFMDLRMFMRYHRGSPTMGLYSRYGKTNIIGTGDMLKDTKKVDITSADVKEIETWINDCEKKFDKIEKKF